MKNEPCIRFGMRISPKISEKPADSRNSRPPKVTLFTVRTSQKFMRRSSVPALCPGPVSRERSRSAATIDSGTRPHALSE